MAMADELRRFSLVKGADPDPVGVTALVAAVGAALARVGGRASTASTEPTLDGWELGAVDLERDGRRRRRAGDAGRSRAARCSRRRGDHAQRAVDDWLAAEDARDAAGAGEVERGDRGGARRPRRRRSTRRRRRRPPRSTACATSCSASPAATACCGRRRRRPRRTAAPDGAAGAARRRRLRLTRARLRRRVRPHLDVPRRRRRDARPRATRRRTSRRAGAAAAAAAPGALAVPARRRRHAGGATGAEARVDQVDPTLQVSPVAGLPAARPPRREPRGLRRRRRARSASCSTSRSAAASCGRSRRAARARRRRPAVRARRPAQQPLGWFAAGRRRRRRRRSAGAARAADRRESALSALLRAIDTTLWTVDTFAALRQRARRRPGRPADRRGARPAAPRAAAADDDVDLSDPARAAEWAAAERALAARMRSRCASAS